VINSPNRRNVGTTLCGTLRGPELRTQGNDAAIRFRDNLLAKKWPKAIELARCLGAGSDAESWKCAARLRRDGILFGVWSTPEKCFVYPDFQFDDEGRLISDVASLLEVLTDEDDRGGWRRAFWLYSPHALLDGRTPADVFPTDPAAVIWVARAEFNAPLHAMW
jgi:hypothetical protein